MFGVFRRKRRRRVLVLGLDCVPPELVFGQLRDTLPHLRRLMDGGTWGILESSIPCITVPAWSSMFSGKDPGELGLYGFRNRAGYGYEDYEMADSRAVSVKRVWDYAGEAGLESLVVNVPQTYPVSPVRGHLVSGFLTPGLQSVFTYPAIDKQAILKRYPNYAFDIRGFRRMPREQLLTQLQTMMDRQYDYLEYALTEEAWDIALHVNIGTDRIHHGFWRYHDPQHRLHTPDSPFRDAIRDYYRRLDGRIGRILDRLDDDVVVLVVSDHGAKRMDGAIAINEWLWREGWLTLKTPPPPDQVVAFDHSMVDWSRTRAWSTGGYYGRIFLNVAGREPQGVIPAEDYERVRNDLADRLRGITGAEGEALNTTVYKPEQIYRAVTGYPPDLLVYFGELHWRTVGSLGYGRHYTLENDTGPDDANHAPEGIYILYDPRQRGRGEQAARPLIDIAPTICYYADIPYPDPDPSRVI